VFRRLYRPADVDAEDLLNYEDHRMIAPLVGHGPVGGNLTIAGRNLDFARGEAGGVGGDGFSRVPLDGQRESDSEFSNEELAAVVAGFGQQAGQVFVHVVGSQYRFPIL